VNPANVLVSTLTLGSIYALVAISLNILYKPTNVFNFAQGGMVMLGAMLGAVVAGAGLPWLVTLVVVVASGGVLGWLIDRIAVTPLLNKSASATGWIASTLAVSLIIENLAGKAWDSTPRVVPPPEPTSTQVHDIIGVPISSYQIVLVVVTVLIAIAIELIYRTRPGLAVSAVAEDREAAQLRGISPGRLSVWSFVLGGALASLAGLLAGPILYASVTLGPQLLVFGFAAAALGGIGSTRGGVLGGYVVGAVGAVATGLAPGLQPLALFTVALAILYVRPSGVFGQPVARAV
jgi:branched-chain amino acid transport system permease protein